MTVVSIRHLTVRYPDGNLALREIAGDIEPNETVGIVGPNGAGKTTLFLCLAGVLPVPAGTIEVAGLNLASAHQRRLLPTKLGIVFQDSEDQLFGSTVVEDVAFGPLNLGLSVAAARERAAEALHHVSLDGLEERVPFHLSGGEKRRVALAGILAMKPEVLLLDEPSSQLDPRGRRQLIDLVNRLPGTRLMATHDLELVLQTCARTWLLDEGWLIADGPTSSILADKALMERHGLEVPYSLR